MPEMDGFGLYEEIRKIDSKVKVRFITAFEINYQATLLLSVCSSHIFSGLTFFYNLIWFVEIFVRGFILKSFLVRVTM
jgi:DNA-binding LytR/AlgR family response regulator